jgi:choline dehydrogenase-like flavoprotein
LDDPAGFDLCIIGSGFAGSMIASELASTGKRIAIVEAGDWDDREATLRAVAQGTVPLTTPTYLDSPISVHAGQDWARGWSHNVGGHLWWTAFALRPMETSFRTSSLYGVGEDWPISYDELEPYFCKAEDELGVSGDSSIGPRRSRPYPMQAMPFSYADEKVIAALRALGVKSGALPVARNRVARRGRAACCFSGTCGTCPTTAKYRADLAHVQSAIAAKNVTLFKQHVGLRLVLDARGRVDHLLCALPDRSERTISAGTFVVACNTVESARLLLASAQDGHPRGLGNRHDQVGRYLMDHMDVAAGGRSPAPLFMHRSAVAVLVRQFEDGPLRKERAGFFFTPGASFDALSTAKMLVEEQGLFGEPFKQGLLDSLSHVVGMSAQLEMLPVAGNRVELDPDHRDLLGRPGLRITLRCGEYEQRGAAAAYEVMSAVLKKMGITQVFGGPEILGSGAHAMGTTRMGTDPARSVVDRRLRVHDVDNLYVASSATFPTSNGAANPTLTLVALSLRLAEHLGKEVLR